MRHRLKSAVIGFALACAAILPPLSCGCASTAVPLSAVQQTRTALDATTTEIRVIAAALTTSGAVLDTVCQPAVVVALPRADAAPAAPEPATQLPPPAGCDKALAKLDDSSAAVDRLQDLLDLANRGFTVVEAAAELAEQ